MLGVILTACLMIAGALIPAQSVQPYRQSVPAFAIDSRTGEPRDLAPANIEVRGISATTVAVERLTGPRHVVLLLDLSSSVRSTQVRWKNTFDTLQEFLRQYGTGDCLALHAFAARHRVLVPFSYDTSGIQKKLDRLGSEDREYLYKEYGGPTEVTDALQRSLDVTKTDLRLGDAIVLISDGEFTRVDAKRLQRTQMELCVLGIRVCILRTAEMTTSEFRSTGEVPASVLRNRNKTLINEWEQNQLGLVSCVGGMVLIPQEMRIFNYENDRDWRFKPERMAGAAKALASFIRDAYRVELEIRESVLKPRRITLQFRDPQGGKEDKVQIQHPQWILAQGEYQ